MTELESNLKDIITELYQNNIIIYRLQSNIIYCNVRKDHPEDFMSLLKKFKSIISPLRVGFKVVEEEEFNPTSLDVQLSLVSEVLYPYVMRYKNSR